jgi:phosphohistidine phosphatase
MSGLLRLLIARHAIAIDREHPNCPADPLRPLTRKGHDKAVDVFRALAAFEEPPERILTSPYLRARQTAQLLARAFGLDPSACEVLDSITPDDRPEALFLRLRELRASRVAVVGHAPHLDLAIAWAIGCPQPFTHLKKAGVAVLELGTFDGGGAVLHALYEPRVLRCARGGSPTA